MAVRTHLILLLSIATISVAAAVITSKENVKSLSASREEAPAGKSEEVGWQSIFWGLFTLALHAMTLPSVLDVHQSQSNLLFPARASPFVCATDALEVLVYFFYETIQGLRPRTAASIICSRRLRDRQGSEISSSAFPGQSALQQHPKASLVIFLVSLTQAVKIFAFQGAWWPKVFAAMYLSSYIVLAATTLLANTEYSAFPDIDRKLQRNQWPAFRLGIISIIVGGVLGGWALVETYDSRLKLVGVDEHGKKVELSLFMSTFGLLGFAFGTYFFITILAFSSVVSHMVIYRWHRGLPGVLFSTATDDSVFVNPYLLVFSFLIGLLGQTWAWFLFGNHLFQPYEYHPIAKVIRCICIGFGMILVVLGLSILVIYQVQSFHWRFAGLTVARYWERALENIILVPAALTYLAAAFMYCAYAYDSEGTVKPSWTNMLG